MSSFESSLKPVPVYVLGDSTVCSLADRLYRAAGRTYLFRGLYCPGLRARDFVEANGDLGSRIAGALAAERLLVLHGEVLKAAHTTTSTHWRWVRDLEERAAGAPPIVVAAGMIDLHEVSVGISEPDLALPEDLLNDPATPEVCRSTVPGALGATQAVARYAAALEPLRRGLRRLRALGFSRLGVMGLAPVTLDDDGADLATTVAGFPAIPRPFRTAFRYKGLLIANAELTRLAHAENAVFVDRWTDFVGNDGLVRADVLRDFMHVTPEAPKRTAAAIVSKLVERDSGVVPSMPERSDASDLHDGRADGGMLFRQALPDPRLAAVHALAAARPGDRVLDVGHGRAELANALAADGAHVTKIERGADATAAASNAYDGPRMRFIRGDAMLSDDPGAYDTAVATHLGGGTNHAAGRLYRDVATALRGSGTFVVHAVRAVPASSNLAGDPCARPNRLRRLLSAAFPHVIVWLADAEDARGSLARGFTLAEARAATDVFAVASHRPLETSELLSRITNEPVELDDMQLSLTEPYAPHRVVRGQSFFAELTLHNGSDAVLSSFGPNPIRFGPVWLDAAGKPAAAEQRAAIAPAAQPNDSARYTFEVGAPATPGRYTLRLGIVQEFVRWYSASADVTVVVV